MNPHTRITLLDDGGVKFFGEGPARLLHAVEATGSLRAAAASMDMAYTKALNILKNAESALGFPLTARAAGGAGGGGSRVTDEGRAFLLRYEAYRDACVAQNAQLLAQFFPAKPRISCVIMASGMGRRFGGNKLMADFRGEPMIARALAATDDLFAERVVVTRRADVTAYCQARGLRVVLHDLSERNDTVRLGLEALGEADGCLFLPGDQPLLSRETIAGMIRRFEEHPQAIVRAGCTGIPGSPVLFPRWAFDELKTLPEGAGGNAVVKRYPERVRMYEVEDACEMMDVDTREDLIKLMTIAV